MNSLSFILSRRWLTRAIPCGVLITLLAIFGTATVAAQDVSPISVEVDRVTATTDDTITLTVRVRAGTGTIPQPEIPPLDGFFIAGRSQSTQMSMVNNIVSAESVYQYFLRPMRSGDLTIPAITINANGQAFSTQPVTVQITQGTGAPQPGGAAPSNVVPAQPNDDRVFVEGAVDNNTPYVGEQVLYKFRFYQAIILGGRSNYNPPSFTGFWNNAQQNQTEYTTTLNGVEYRVTELTNVLFPTNAGQLTIEPTRLTIPGSFVGPDYLLETEPVSVNVQPLPAGAPPDFSGAVGQFTLTAQVDTAQIDTSNNAATLTLTIAGNGNLDALPDPTLPDSADWLVYPGSTATNASLQNGVYGGTRTYEYELVPTQEGAVTFPPISYTYFDPVDEQYETATTNPMTITVAPGAAQAGPQQTASAVAPAAEPTAQPEPAVAPTAETRPLKAAPPVLESGIPSLVSQPLFWVLWAVPLAALAGEVFWRRRERYLSANADRLRSARALKQARKALKQARRKEADGYGAASRILTSYLTDKIQQPLGGLTRSALGRVLHNKGLSPAMIQQIESCLISAEAGRFSPDRNGHGPSILNDTERLIVELDKELAA